MKTLFMLASLSLSVVACGQSDVGTKTRDNASQGNPGQPSVPGIVLCDEDTFVATPAGDAILVLSKEGATQKKIFPFIENHQVKLAISDAATSCVKGEVVMARWGHVTTPFAFKTGRDGEPRYSLIQNEKTYAIGKGTATPTLCGSKDDCSFVAEETDDGRIHIEFRARQNGETLWQDSLELPEAPQFVPVFGFSNEVKQ